METAKLGRKKKSQIFLYFLPKIIFLDLNLVSRKNEHKSVERSKKEKRKEMEKFLTCLPHATDQWLHGWIHTDSWGDEKMRRWEDEIRKQNEAHQQLLSQSAIYHRSLSCLCSIKKNYEHNLMDGGRTHLRATITQNVQKKKKNNLMANSSLWSSSCWLTRWLCSSH